MVQIYNNNGDEKKGDAEKIMKCFEQLSLNMEQLAVLTDYLEDKISEEELDKIEQTNLSQVTHEQIEIFRSTMSAFFKEENEKAIYHFFNAQFAVGGITSYKLFPWFIWKHRKLKDGKLCGIAPAKLCAVISIIVTENVYTIRRETLYKLKEYANENPQNLRSAMAYYDEQSNQFDSGKIMLLADYFLMKYSYDVKNMTEDATIEVKSEDSDLLEVYEELLLSGLSDLLNGALHADTTQQITEDIRRGRRKEAHEKIPKEIQLKLYSMYVICGSAYMNFRLSGVLQEIVSLCLVANINQTIDIMQQMDVRRELYHMGNFDQIFGIDAYRLIVWAAQKGSRAVLLKQFIRNRECYLAILREEAYEDNMHMLSVIKKKDKALYDEIIQKKSDIQRERLISTLAGNAPQAALYKEYLRGNVSVDELCAPPKIPFPISPRHQDEMDQYFLAHAEDTAFYHRCVVYLLMIKSWYSFLNVIWDVKHKEEKVRQIFQICEEEHVSRSYQLYSAIQFDKLTIYDSTGNQQRYHTILQDIFGEYLRNNREEMATIFASASVEERCLGLQIYRKDTATYKEEIWTYIEDSSKIVKEEVIEIVCEHEEWSQDILMLLQSKKAAQRTLAVSVLQTWGVKKYEEELQNALKKEKSKKISEQILAALGIEREETVEKTSRTKENIVQQTLKGNRKRTVEWAYETPFSIVHKKDKTLVQQEYLQAILVLYASMTPCGINKEAAELAEELDSTELMIYMGELFDKWIARGAEAKKKWVLYATSIHGGMQLAKKIYHHIQEWPKNARGAIATEAVRALALSSQGLLIVDGIARKFKYRQVRTAALEALDFAAKELGLTRAQLGDRIVPNLGFDTKAERIFDYGSRTFTVAITPTLELEVTGEDGKKLKNLPAPGKRDEDQKASKAYAAYKEVKKQLKEVVSNQKERLETALCAARRWSREQWQDLFVKNPVMHQFAIGLIWGIYEKEALLQSFRYMEDGSFVDAVGEEYLVPEHAQIGLVHPLELSQQEKEEWNTQFEDYELIQPFEQLHRKIYQISKEEEQQKSLERFSKTVLNALFLSGKMQKLGWYHGSVHDGGNFYNYYREDLEIGLGAQLEFSGCCIVPFDEDVTIGGVRFFKVGTVERGSYADDEVKDSQAIFLQDVPARYFSEVVLQIESLCK